jgi:hypothetical protein
VTPHIPGTGLYKLIAKKKVNGEIEWAHFIHRDNGDREVVFRGTARNEAELKQVLELANKHLGRTSGAHIGLRTSIMEMRTLDGRKVSETKH